MQVSDNNNVCLFTLLYYSQAIGNSSLTSTEVWEYQMNQNAEPTILSLQQIRTGLHSLVQQNIAIEHNGFFSLHKQPFYNARQQRITQSIHKWFIVQKKVRFIAWMPFIRRIDMLGSVATNNAKQQSDLDLCIITSHNTLWSVMFCSILIASLLRVKRNKVRVKDQLCFNHYTNNAHNPYPQDIHPFFSQVQKHSVVVYVCKHTTIKQAIETTLMLSGFVKICEKIGYTYFKNKKVPKDSSAHHHLWRLFYTPPTHAISYIHKIQDAKNILKHYRTIKSK